MDNYQETFETWNAIAGLYQEKFMDLRLYDETYAAFCNAIPQQNARILDAGCGPGNITRYLLSRRPDFRIDGIDVAPNMVELAIRNNPAANFQVLDIRELHRLESVYDGIICGFCLPFLSESDCQKLLADACALLSDRGVLYLSFVEGDPGQSGFKTGGDGQRVYFYYHGAAGLSAQLARLGFEAPEIFRVNFERGDGRADEEHCVLLARRKIEIYSCDIEGTFSLGQPTRQFTGTIILETRDDCIYFSWKINSIENELLASKSAPISFQEIPKNTDKYEFALNYAKRSIENFRINRKEVFRIQKLTSKKRQSVLKK